MQCDDCKTPMVFMGGAVSDLGSDKLWQCAICGRQRTENLRFADEDKKPTREQVLEYLSEATRETVESLYLARRLGSFVNVEDLAEDCKKVFGKDLEPRKLEFANVGYLISELTGENAG